MMDEFTGNLGYTNEDSKQPRSPPIPGLTSREPAGSSQQAWQLPQRAASSQPNSSISPPAAPSPALSHIPPRIRRRNRLITSCLECRRRKLKCDKSSPCGNCTRAKRQCLFMASTPDPAAQQKLAKIKEKMGSLERTLEEDVTRARQRTSVERNRSGDVGPGVGDEEEDEFDEEDVPEDERDLEAHPYITNDVAYYEDADDDLMDLGIQLGKMRITERIGGLARPKLADELKYVIKEVMAEHGEPETSSTPPGFLSSQMSCGPGPDFVAPAASFFFAPEPLITAVMQYMPSKDAADQLMQQYWKAVHPVARIVHRPSFERQYKTFWEHLQGGIEGPASFAALVLATLFSAILSMDSETVLSEYGVVKSQLVDNFREGTETMLSRAHFLRTTKLETLQAFVMYLIPMCRSEISRAHSALTGTAIRIAEGMGLHRDGSLYGLVPVQLHVRRLIWHQICFLDIRTADAVGPRPQIRREDYDTRLPLNVDDVDLESRNPPTQDEDRWTDMTLTLMRMECNQMHRRIWVEQTKLEQKRTNLTTVVRKIQNFLTKSEKKYMHLFDRTKPLQYFAYLAYKILTLRMYINVLHRYSGNQLFTMPDRLRQLLINSGLGQLEAAIQIDTTPLLKTWAWYGGTFQQYHVALLLYSELYTAEPYYHERRIWKSLDYVFELSPSVSPLEKSKQILLELSRRADIFQTLRKVRTPTTMLQHVAPRKPGAPNFSEEASPETLPPNSAAHKRNFDAHISYLQSGAAMNQQASPMNMQQIAGPQHAPVGRGPLEKFPRGFNAGPWGSDMSESNPPDIIPPPANLPPANFGALGDMSFGGIANGEAVYVPAIIMQGSSSPEDGLFGPSAAAEDGMAIADEEPEPQPNRLPVAPENAGQGGFDIDWSAFDQVFPPSMTFESMGDLMVPDFQFGSQTHY
ncbi:hypothetical protein P152DRAFT_408376 [Eremomyces bilateralis CBS 781.70]|uniref:Zn(2)-C6 fungal-type domain-containing protein n=1 Tax=Eremomyces bilateralis CBS 781.70 TaxID=1392243 RepID=A0A6G1GHP2_9PEZI|nr:uncharacterized protein P152DRAFT_408376 [Eremomyces bilateralis CBS 781.70]KAF1817617.1 hypothetical protein P152DRAFT_408376 [Eremomyces bilateralis CBS 781.70]